MTEPDLLAALLPVLHALEALGVRHYVGGSLASSAHGVPRSSIDADVVADLHAEHADPFVSALRDSYYVPEARVSDAIARRASFNVIHLETMIKVDVFVARDRPFDRLAFERARVEPLGEGGRAPVPICSAEDTILAKLEWFRLGGELSERQWSDVTGLLETMSEKLDLDYLGDRAAELGVLDLLTRAVEESRERDES